MTDKHIAVIFDMDGVIFDSEQAYIDVYRELLTRDGITFIEQACIDSIGTNIQRTREIWREYYGDAVAFEPYNEEARGIMRRRAAGSRTAGLLCDRGQLQRYPLCAQRRYAPDNGAGYPAAGR